MINEKLNYLSKNLIIPKIFRIQKDRMDNTKQKNSKYNIFQ